MLSAYRRAVESAELVRRTGRVKEFFGLVVDASGPEAFLGEGCEIHSRRGDPPVHAEVVGIKNGSVLLMPYGELHGISLDSEVIATGKQVEIPVGRALLGRVVDAFGRPLDGRPAPRAATAYPLQAPPINPLTRPPIREVLETGVRCIDTLLTLGRGQRVGIFAGSGVGKSSLLGMIAHNMNADVNVIAMIGERGREVREFLDEILGQEGLARSVVVVATSDQPALVRAHAALSATAIAEYFRDQGLDVVLTMDSITRFAMARREVALAVGEPPTSRGYTPSVFANLSRLLERGGTCGNGGSITSFFTVLAEGDDLNDPVADSVRAVLDGNLVLSRPLANEGHYPAIDVLRSNSRLMQLLASDDELACAGDTVRMLSTFERSRDLVEIGAYEKGANPDLDRALALHPALGAFLSQRFDERITRADAFARLSEILQSQGGPRGE
jgi:flagellum-specific ATP synthase